MSINILLIIFSIYFDVNTNNNLIYLNKDSVNLVNISPPSLQVYHSVNKYAKQNEIPYKIAFGVAREETSYKSPLDFKYTQKQTSSTGAEGAMQFIPSTIRWLSKDSTLTRTEIRENTELNIKYSMKYLRLLKNRYKKWDIALGYYNTGYPVTNEYVTKILK